MTQSFSGYKQIGCKYTERKSAEFFLVQSSIQELLLDEGKHKHTQTREME